MFGPDGAIRTAWQRLVGIFGDGKDAMGKKFLTWADTLKAFMGFGPDGSFQKMWKGIKGFFGIGGKIATSPGFLLTAEEMVEMVGLYLHAFRRIDDHLQSLALQAWFLLLPQLEDLPVSSIRRPASFYRPLRFALHLVDRRRRCADATALV